MPYLSNRRCFRNSAILYGYRTHDEVIPEVPSVRFGSDSAKSSRSAPLFSSEVVVEQFLRPLE